MTDSEGGVAAEGCRNCTHGKAEDQDLSADGASGQAEARKPAAPETKRREPPLFSIDEETHFVVFSCDTLAQGAFFGARETCDGHDMLIVYCFSKSL